MTFSEAKLAQRSSANQAQLMYVWFHTCKSEYREMVLKHDTFSIVTQQHI